MASPTAWRNRIVGYGDVSPSELTDNPSNWRVHGEAQTAALSGVLAEVGYVQSVIVNRTTGRLVDGHLRAKLARDRGEPSVPVVYVELSESEERLVLATLDPLGALAETDAAALSSLLDSVATDDAAVQALLADLAGSAIPPAEVLPPGEFTEYDDSLATEYCCPSCGYEWSGQPSP